jgi:hypothetical protein
VQKQLKINLHLDKVVFLDKDNYLNKNIMKKVYNPYINQFNFGGDVGAGVAGVAKGILGTIPGVGSVLSGGVDKIHNALDKNITEQEQSIAGFGQAAGGIGAGILTGNVAGAVSQGAQGLAQGVSNLNGVQGGADNALNAIGQIGGMAGGLMGGGMAYGGQLYAGGGSMYAQGAQMPQAQMTDVPVTEFNTGGSHEANPHNGIPQGMNPNGQPNLVEEGELKITIPGTDEKFIVSPKIKLDKNTAKEFGLDRKYVGKDMVKIFNKILRSNSNREGDSIEENSKNLEIMPYVKAHSKLSKIQNAKDAAKDGEFMHGGNMYENGNPLPIIPAQPLLSNIPDSSQLSPSTAPIQKYQDQSLPPGYTTEQYYNRAPGRGGTLMPYNELPITQQSMVNIANRTSVYQNPDGTLRYVSQDDLPGRAYSDETSIKPHEYTTNYKLDANGNPMYTTAGVSEKNPGKKIEASQGGKYAGEGNAVHRRGEHYTTVWNPATQKDQRVRSAYLAGKEGYPMIEEGKNLQKANGGNIYEDGGGLPAPVENVTVWGQPAYVPPKGYKEAVEKSGIILPDGAYVTAETYNNFLQGKGTGTFGLPDNYDTSTTRSTLPQVNTGAPMMLSASGQPMPDRPLMEPGQSTSRQYSQYAEQYANDPVRLEKKAFEKNRIQYNKELLNSMTEKQQKEMRSYGQTPGQYLNKPYGETFELKKEYGGNIFTNGNPMPYINSAISYNTPNAYGFSGANPSMSLDMGMPQSLPTNPAQQLPSNVGEPSIQQGFQPTPGMNNSSFDTSLDEGIKNVDVQAGIGSTIGQYAPIAYNLAMGMQKPDKVSAGDFYQPISAQNIDYSQALNENKQAFAGAVKDIGAVTSGGSYLTNRASLASRAAKGAVDISTAEKAAQQAEDARVQQHNAQMKSQGMGQALEYNKAAEAQKQAFLQEGVSGIANLARASQLDKLGAGYAGLQSPDVDFNYYSNPFQGLRKGQPGSPSWMGSTTTNLKKK